MFSSDIEIRAFTPDDQVAARHLILQGLGERFGFIDASKTPDLDDIFHNYIAPGHVFLVAYQGLQLVGTGALITVSEGTGRIVRISTRTDQRRQGIGTMIVQKLLGIARMRGYTRVLVSTNHTWHDAINLYRKMGFVKYDEDDDEGHMVLYL